MSKQGYVYVLTNAAMPGLVKIGHSVNCGKTRARDIYQTGVPLPFDVAFEMLVDDSYEIEQLVHEDLQKDRVSEQREFFRCDTIDAIHSVIRVYLQQFEQYMVCGDEFGALQDLAATGYSANIHWIEAVTSVECLTPEEMVDLVERRKALLKKRRMERENKALGKSEALTVVENG